LVGGRDKIETSETGKRRKRGKREREREIVWRVSVGNRGKKESGFCPFRFCLRLRLASERVSERQSPQPRHAIHYWDCRPTEVIVPIAEAPRFD
jgi:hypothetical protein